MPAPVLSMITSNGGDLIRKADVNGVMTDRFAANDAKTIEAIQYFVSMARDDKSVYLGGAPLSDEEHIDFMANKYALSPPILIVSPRSIRIWTAITAF